MRLERKIWAGLKHPNIVPFLGYAEGEEKFGPLGALISPVSYPILHRADLTLLQWYKNGDAGQFLRTNGRKMTDLYRSRLVSTHYATSL
jgi:hypothetical protein